MADRFASRRALLIATPLALLAALVVLVVLGGDDGDDVVVGGAPSSSAGPGLTLEPEPPRADSLAEITLRGLDGDNTDLAAVLDGRPAVVNFFGSWCAPCVREMPAFQAVHEDVGDEVAFVGLAVNDRPEAARRIVEETGVEYATYDDHDSLAFTFFGAVRMPATVFLSADGEVLARKDGELSEQQLRDQVADLYDAEA